MAVSRIANVPGRIILLVLSIITRNGRSKLGAPWGTRCANIWIVFLIHPNNIKVSHKGNLIVRVKIIWLVQVKIYGNKPRKLLNKIKVNKDTKIIDLPLNSGVLIKFLNSICRVETILIHTILIREGTSQNIGGIIIIPKKVLNQFIEKLKFVVGSKVENRFVIIFN